MNKPASKKIETCIPSGKVRQTSPSPPHTSGPPTHVAWAALARSVAVATTAGAVQTSFLRTERRLTESGLALCEVLRGRSFSFMLISLGLSVVPGEDHVAVLVPSRVGTTPRCSRCMRIGCGGRVCLCEIDGRLPLSHRVRRSYAYVSSCDPCSESVTCIVSSWIDEAWCCNACLQRIL